MNTQILIDPPSEVRLRKASKIVEVLWPDGYRSELSCLDLRRSCACSSCQQDQRSGRLRLIDADIGIDRLELAGVSGLQFHFSDGHNRGLYPWGYLRQLSEPLS